MVRGRPGPAWSSRTGTSPVCGTRLRRGPGPGQAAAPERPLGVWDRVADCESGGDWSINTGNGYSGGLQFSHSTWRAYGGEEFAPLAYQASREEQIIVAERVLDDAGWGAWPTCSRNSAALTARDRRVRAAEAPPDLPRCDRSGSPVDRLSKLRRFRSSRCAARAVSR